MKIAKNEYFVDEFVKTLTITLTNLIIFLCFNWSETFPKYDFMFLVFPSIFELDLIHGLRGMSDLTKLTSRCFKAKCGPNFVRITLQAKLLRGW